MTKLAVWESDPIAGRCRAEVGDLLGLVWKGPAVHGAPGWRWHVVREGVGVDGIAANTHTARWLDNEGLAHVGYGEEATREDAMLKASNALALARQARPAA